MILILTMAGLYSRFVNEGFKFPKYLLPWGDRTILSAVLAEMTKQNVFKHILLIGNRRDEPYQPHIQAVLRKHSIPANHLHMISDTRGQAETAWMGIQFIENLYPQFNGPICFHNIDTLLLNRDYRLVETHLQTAKGYVDVLRSNSPDYSYVLTDSQMHVQEIAEKVVISNIATSGFYGFADAQTFKSNYKSDQDLFVTAVYNSMLKKDLTIQAGPTHSGQDTLVLGTPAEYIQASLVANLN